MQSTRRHWVGGSVALACWMLSPHANATGYPVFDIARFTQMTLQLQELAKLYTALKAGLDALRSAATHLGGGRLVDDILLQERYITQDLSSMGYHLQTVSTQFQRVFPTEDAVRNTPTSDVDALSRGWDGEIHQSALAAARAQTALSTIDRNTRSASAILERSKTTTEDDRGSQLAKLQAVVQMLGVLNSDLATLATTVATTERVNASLAGTEASEAEVGAERRRRLLRGYSEPVRTSDGLDPRFLR